MTWRSQIATHGTRLETEPIQRRPQPTHWSFATRIAFRFCFVYFGLYCLVTQISISLIPTSIDIPELDTLWPMRQIILWVTAHLFRVNNTPVYSGGSGDKTVDWVLVFCLFVVAGAATTVWSIVDRKRENYFVLHKWFRLFIRFCLAGQMISYGLAKAVPLQMPSPNLARLIEPFGNFSPMGVLWASVGASPAYEIFAGCAELLAGILLIFPRTTTLGAIVCLADVVQVFVLNMTYDVPVKLLSFQLLLMSLLLLVPDFERLANLFFLDRTAAPSAQPPLFTTPRANHIALAAQIIFGASLLGANAYGSWTAWHHYGGGSPKSTLYGIWNVDQLTIDGQVRPPLITDNDRWRRVIFDSSTRMAFQRMDDSFARYGASINVNGKTVAVTKDDDKNWKASFTFQRPAPDQLILDGNMDSRKVHMQLQLIDRKKFLLVSRGFHWIQEYPFNR